MLTLETRYFDNGKAYAKIHNKAIPKSRKSTDSYDQYFEPIGKNGEYETLKQWVSDLIIKQKDIPNITRELKSGKTVEITAYI